MKCTRCNKNEATMYFKQNINGEIREFALCPECAAGDGVGLGSPFAHLSLFGPSTLIKRAEKKRCELCGSSIEEIRSRGKVGCGKCYDVFSEELSSIVNSIHGSANHIPREGTEADTKSNDIEKLRAEQRAAIENEDYERAAELRDRIREMEGK